MHGRSPAGGPSKIGPPQASSHAARSSTTPPGVINDTGHPATPGLRCIRGTTKTPSGHRISADHVVQRQHPATIGRQMHRRRRTTPTRNHCPGRSVRPHRALRRRTPIETYNDRPKAFPTGYQIPPHYRVRHDKIDAAGVITIRYNSHLHHIGLSKRRRGTKVIVLADDLDIRVLDRDTGALIRKLVLDPTRDYQPRGVKCGNSPENRL